MTSRIKIRSIYSTALTGLILDSGYSVVEPSPRIRERFALDHLNQPYDILARDRDDFQGLELSGQPEMICQFLTFLQEHLLDVVLVELDQDESDDGIINARIEFPGASKDALDGIRLAVTPTLHRHHRLRIIDAKALEKAESRLHGHPEKKPHLEKEIFLQTIFLPIEKAGIVRVEHVRPSGKSMRPREGVLVRANPAEIVFRRSFLKGRYDGLDLPIQPGDYGLTTVQEGAWFIKHDYFSKDNRLIGEYYNINTPVEFYPYGARYLDLEVDVIRRPGENPVLLDREKLALLSRRGFIGNALESKAIQVADEILKTLTP